MQKIIKLLTSRVIIVVCLIAIQAGYLFSFFYRTASTWKLMPVFSVLSILMALYIFNRNEDSEFKMVWCMLVLALPLIGIPLYLLCAGKQMPKKLYMATTKSSERMSLMLKQDLPVMEHLQEKHPGIHRIFNYALIGSHFPVYENTTCTYYGSGEEMYPALLAELAKAEHFIFLEYFIIDHGKMWTAILDILQKKARDGVEVKLIYDDFGCSSMPWHYDRQLREMGIEAYSFNRLRPALIIQMNNRDHRKICVIDNRVAFTGGINLADEYINRRVRFGYWRDSAIMLKGDAVWSFTDIFLGMYSFLKEDSESLDYNRYHLPAGIRAEEGLFQPFADTPTDEYDVGLSMHLNVINNARRYVYINTPYLVLNADMTRALTLAAENGVDVRILVPHIPDKQYVFVITRSNYEILMKKGVRIYEYTPGFNHCKDIVSDDNLAIVGTVNTDYRSYFMHFEDGVLIYASPEILHIRKEFEQALAKSHEVTMKEVNNTDILIRLMRGFLRLMAPLF